MIVGLGNLGDKFFNTRHNIGFLYVNMLADYLGILFKKEKKFLADIAIAEIYGNKIYLVKPNTFMNLSGFPVFRIAHFYKIKFSEILVVRDELDLLPGYIKIRKSYKANGHNGVKSIMKIFKEKNIFLQLCIGIGRPNCKKKVSDFVLKMPNNHDKYLIIRIINIFLKNTKNFFKYTDYFYNKKFFTSDDFSINNI